MKFLIVTALACALFIAPQAVASSSESSPLQKLLDNNDIGDAKVSRDFILKDQLLKSNQRNLALIQVTPKKSQSGTNPEYQTSELTDTVILINGGSQLISDSLYARVFFSTILSKSLTLDEQKCMSDGMNMQNLYAILYEQSYAYVTKQGPQKVGEELKSLIDTGFAQHWHNVSVLRTMHDQDETKYRTAINDYITTMKKEPELKNLIDSMENDKFEGIFGLLPISADELMKQTIRQCQAQAS